MGKRLLARVLSLCIALAVYIPVSNVAIAQSDNGTINGTVADPSGAVIPKATVTVKNQATGAERSEVTNEAGLYSITNIPPGAYTVTVIASGFKKCGS